MQGRGFADGDGRIRCNHDADAGKVIAVFGSDSCDSARASPMPDIAPFSLQAVFVIAQQILIGAAMGLVTVLLVQTFVLTGQIIGMQTSLGFASMVDPASGQQTPVVGNLFLLLTTMIFWP